MSEAESPVKPVYHRWWIPVIVLVFFSTTDVLPTGTDDPVEFLLPGVLALAIMSTGMVSNAISTGFERQFGVLKRLGSSPLTRAQLLIAKTASIVAIEAAQVIILLLVGLALGFDFSNSNLAWATLAVIPATVAFAGLGLLIAGSLPALTTLAATNGIYLVLLLTSGMVFPITELPGAIQTVTKVLPANALAEIFHTAFAGTSIPGGSVIVLLAWAIAAPLAAARFFRWE